MNKDTITDPSVGRASTAPSVHSVQEDASHLRHLLNNLNARLESLEMTPQRTPALSPKVAMPDKFDGTSSKCRRFIASVENLFVLQTARYGTAEIKTRLIGSLLSGDALTWFTGVVDHSPELLLNYENFIAELKNLFDDPHYQRHACNALTKLKPYAAKFRHLALKSGYNEIATIDLFRFGI